MSEYDIQVSVVQWARLNECNWPELRWLHHIPNGGYRGKPTVTRKGNVLPPLAAQRMKAAGVKKGIPDLCLPFPRKGYHGLYLEVKADNGSVSREQKECIAFLQEQGYCVCVGKGYDQCVDALRSYLEGD